MIFLMHSDIIYVLFQHIYPAYSQFVYHRAIYIYIYLYKPVYTWIFHMVVSISIQVIRDKVVLIPWWSRLNRNILFPIAGSTISICPVERLSRPTSRWSSWPPTHTHARIHVQTIIFRIDKRDRVMPLLLLVNEPILITRRKDEEKEGEEEKGKRVDARPRAKQFTRSN